MEGGANKTAGERAQAAALFPFQFRDMGAGVDDIAGDSDGRVVDEFDGDTAPVVSGESSPQGGFVAVVAAAVALDLRGVCRRESGGEEGAGQREQETGAMGSGASGSGVLGNQTAVWRATSRSPSHDEQAMRPLTTEHRSQSERRERSVL